MTIHKLTAKWVASTAALLPMLTTATAHASVTPLVAVAGPLASIGAYPGGSGTLEAIRTVAASLSTPTCLSSVHC